jgi:YVTN family beta-propeller protein
MAINPNRNLINAADYYFDISITGGPYVYDETWSIINGSTNKVEANVTAGSSSPRPSPRPPSSAAEESATAVAINSSDVAINPITNMVYVAHTWPPMVSVINGSTNKVEANVTVGNYTLDPSSSYLRDLDINPKTNMIYVTQPEIGTMSIINGSTNKVEANVTAGYSRNPL